MVDSKPDRDPYEVTIELIRTVRDEQRIGFERLEKRFDVSKLERDAHCTGHAKRIELLELWKATVEGSYRTMAAVGSFIGAVLGALVTWLAGRHH